MKMISELNLGFADAENYRRKENKELFNSIFVKNEFLDNLLRENTFFLIGEKGTGKTAYAVYLSNNDYKDTISDLKYIRETDYDKFVTLKREKHLQLTHYESIWKVIIYLLMAKGLEGRELDHHRFAKSKKMRALMQAIDEYYANAFSPEILYALNWIDNSKVATELITKFLKLGGEQAVSTSVQESHFQVHLFYIQKQFEEAFNEMKMKNNHVLFIDGIDIRPGLIPYQEYLDCVKGLANAVWSVNNDFFSNIKDSKGRLRTVLLLRPDIFNSIGLQNASNKIRDNSVYLDWRTTYPNFNNSQIFHLSDKLLSSQQGEKREFGQAWDYYFPWKTKSQKPNREYDAAFVSLLKISYSRPRDIVTILQILQEEAIEKRGKEVSVFTEKDINGHDFLNKYSEYLMAGIKDQLSFYYNEEDYDNYLRFFSFLNGRAVFDYEEYLVTYNKFADNVRKNYENVPEFIETADLFLQFLYDTNIVGSIEIADRETFFRWCYRERNPSNIAPKVRLEARYRIHKGLHKALNVGYQKIK